MPRSLLDDPLELLRVDIAVPIFVEVKECLAHPLALESTQHLRKLGICHGVAMAFPADIELGPVTIPVERDAGLVARIDILELVEVDLARDGVGEEAEGDFVLGVRFREQVVEDAPVLQADAVLAAAVGDLEKDGVLVALDLVL